MDLLQEQLGVAGVQMETLEKRRRLARSAGTEGYGSSLASATFFTERERVGI